MKYFQLLLFVVTKCSLTLAADGLEWEYRQPTTTVPESDYNDQFTQPAPGVPRYSTQSAPDVPRYTPPAHEQLELQISRQLSHSPPETYTHQPDDDFVEELSRRFDNTELSDRVPYSGDKGKEPGNFH